MLRHGARVYGFVKGRVSVMKKLRDWFFWIVFLSAVVAGEAVADEGMWLFNNPPGRLLKEKYGFEVTDFWLEQLQKSSVRFSSGGSGSFVSEDGLVMSNPLPLLKRCAKYTAPGNWLMN